MTITDVARTAGVSVATVSKVINGRYGVAATTTERVQQVIDDLGYESSLVARSLRSHRTNVIGILVAEFEPFSTEILKGTSQAITGTGYELLAYSGGGRAGPDAGWERRYLSRLSGTLIDGAILVTPTIVDTGASVPVVAIDPHAGPAHMPTVDADNLARCGAGDRAPAARSGTAGSASSAGARTSSPPGCARRATAPRWRAAGVEVDPELVRVGGYRRQSATGPARELLTAGRPPDGDLRRQRPVRDRDAWTSPRELGLSVPDDLSVVGFDNVPESALTHPPLTTVEPAHAADGLGGRRPARPPHERHRGPTARTCGCPPSSSSAGSTRAR